MTEIEDQPRRSAPSAELDALLAGMLDPVVVIDDHGEVLLAGAAVERAFGWSPRELVGRNITVLMPEPHRSRHDDYLARFRETGQTWIIGTTREFQVVRRDGSELTCELSVSRLELPGHDRPCFCGSFRDVTERRKQAAELARSEACFRTVFELESQLVLMLSDAGDVVEVNRTALHLTGARRADVVGRPFEDAPWWIPEVASRAELRVARTDAATRGQVRTRAALRDRDGRQRTVELLLRGVGDAPSGVPPVLVEARDLTELIEAQRRETGVLRALARLGEEAAVLAHEVRSPLSSIRAALRAVANQLGADEREILAELTSRMERLQDLLGRTLGFSRPLDLTPAPVRPDALIGLALERERGVIDGAGVRPVVAIEPNCDALWGDAEHLADLLANLIRNAAEASPAGGTVRIAAERVQGGGSRITVDDEGPGIPTDEREKIFRPFLSTKEAGTGIGLALARKVAEEHGGDLRASTAPLGGARFVLELPAPPTDERSAKGTRG